MPRQKPNSSNNDLRRYAGLAGQIFFSLGIAVFIGYKADGWLHMPIPLFVWLLPLVVLIVMMYKLIKETSQKGKNNE
jgi:uncharacterized membrane protein